MKPQKIIIALAGLVAVFLIFYFDLQRFLTLAALKANRQVLLDYYANHKLLMVSGFMAVYIVQTALSLPGAAILSLAAGAIFGSILGTLSGIASPRVLGSFALLGLFALIPVLYSKFKSR